MKKQTEKWVLGHKISPQKTTGNYDLVIGETPAHTPGPPPHSHKNYTEVFIVTEGKMEFMLNGITKVLNAGESIDLAPNDLHTFGNKTDQTCKWVNIHSPKGFMNFFDTLGVPTNEKDAQIKSIHEAKIQEVIRTATSYDMHLKL